MTASGMLLANSESLAPCISQHQPLDVGLKRAYCSYGEKSKLVSNTNA